MARAAAPDPAPDHAPEEARPGPEAPTVAAPTPMMAQYHALKAEAGDSLLFYRMGDFFELFFDDAVTAAACLDIALTRRGEQGGQGVPMCGVPVHAAETYLARLIRAGHKVAIAEQTETPAEARARGGSKALVARALVRFVTAGTLTEDALLTPAEPNWLVAVAIDGDAGAVAAADVSTGATRLIRCAPDRLSETVSRFAPAELVVSADQIDAAAARTMAACPVTTGEPAWFDPDAGRLALARLFEPDAAPGLGADWHRAELAAFGALIAYVTRAGAGRAPFLLRPDRSGPTGEATDEPDGAPAFDPVLAIDAASRDSLEILKAQGGGRAGSLVAAIDRTVTGAGARLLADDLSAPLTDRDAIAARHDLVAWLLARDRLRARIIAALRTLPDLARALGRLAAGRGGPRELGQVRDGLAGAHHLAAMLGDALSTEARDGGVGATPAPALLAALVDRLGGHGALADELARALVPEPAAAGDAGFIAEGYDAALDALRATARDGRRAIAALEAEYRQRTGIPTLKVRHNAVLGYHVEVSAGRADALMAHGSGFTHRQTLAGVVRFNAPDLHDAARRVVEAGAHAALAEAAHAEALTAEVLAKAPAIAATAAALARLDVAAGHAVHARDHRWCRPEIVDAPCLAVTGGRHPVVEAALAREGRTFVANDVALDPAGRLWLITGPNMGGKSTFLRQNALIVLLAQAGAYVPATACRLGLVDRLFSRVGASDNLARGRSTFMVEMVETAAILSGATPASFVILDEVGRGTSTYDGLALAWAIVEAVATRNRCRCLFATHYHELVRLSEQLPCLSNHHVRAREWRGELVFLHEVAAGAADRSYGLSVARLAGVPGGVVARAAEVLDRLEAGRARTGGLAAGLDDLPLFAGLVAGAGAEAAERKAPDPLRAALDAIDPDALTPREAHDVLYRLCRLAADGGEADPDAEPDGAP